jgi:hypothetical protein
MQKNHKYLPGGNKKVFSYEYCELGFNFLGFLDVYKTINLPEDFTVIDFGCNQAVQACYFGNCKQYIGIDYIPIEARFSIPNAAHYKDSIQHLIKEVFPGLELTKEKVFAICSYVPDKEAQQMVMDHFPYHKVQYCERILSENYPYLEIEREEEK